MSRYMHLPKGLVVGDSLPGLLTPTSDGSSGYLSDCSRQISSSNETSLLFKNSEECLDLN